VIASEDPEALLRRAYQAFNARDIDGALAMMHDDVDWPNAWEGGRVVGRDAVRAYWTRQFAEIHVQLEPRRVVPAGDDRFAVDVHQIVRDTGGNALADDDVRHVYAFRDGLVARMDLEEAPATSGEALESWGDDRKLEATLGARGAAAFRGLLDGFPTAVGILWTLRDDDGRIVDFAFGYGNPAILRQFRMPAAMGERYTLLEALPQMRGSRAFDAYVRVCETGEPWVHEVTYDTPFGEGYMLGTFDQRVARLGDGVITFLADITDQRRVEADLRNFADVVAHDLREPVTGIAHLVALLERRADEPPSPEVLELLRASTERARELIDGALSYARAGELRRERVALGELVAEVGDDLRPLLDAAGAALEVGRLPEVDGDPRQLRRVVQNLVGNAVKFRGEAPPRVAISALERRRAWVVTVRDNGRGVDPDDAQRIFGMFARAGSQDEGAGIGLAVCRRVVEAHGGRIWVEPAPGGGSAFRFTLPRDPGS